MSGSDKSTGGGVRSMHKIPTKSPLEQRREEYNSYDEDLYNKVYFDERTGGYVIEEKARYEQGQKSKNAKAIYEKEQEMCKVLASHGKRIEHISDASGGFDIQIDGTPADLKRMKGVNNIVHQASRATKKQGAKKVVFRFDKINSKITQKIGELQRKGIHGFYFDDNDFFEY